MTEIINKRLAEEAFDTVDFFEEACRAIREHEIMPNDFDVCTVIFTSMNGRRVERVNVDSKSYRDFVEQNV